MACLIRTRPVLELPLTPTSSGYPSKCVSSDFPGTVPVETFYSWNSNSSSQEFLLDGCFENLQPVFEWFSEVLSQLLNISKHFIGILVRTSDEGSQ